MGTSLEDRPRYTPTTCFETFPLPWSPWREAWRDPRLHAIADAARTLDEQRRAWLDPPRAMEADRKKWTLTNLSNARPAWLQQAHAALDRAVWAADGWDDPDPSAVEDDVLLARLGVGGVGGITGDSPVSRIGLEGLGCRCRAVSEAKSFAAPDAIEPGRGDPARAHGRFILARTVY